MMQETSEIPEWALDKAVALIRAEGAPQEVEYIRGTFAAIALAKVIAEHEEPPVDPLLAEADALYQEWLDGDEGVRPCLLRALRRGTELAHAGES